MAMSVQHVHLKGDDPKKTAQFYIDNLGATVIAEIPGRGVRLNLHGLQLNITGIVADQSRQQAKGIEHLAVETDDYSGTIAKMKANGVTILEEMPPNNGRRVCFLEAPDGAQLEVIEKV
ncbi:MAG TPA: VOC family protein [Stellaceae bacterium]|nr:VOC family protein [Stellaceae bacterium]